MINKWDKLVATRGIQAEYSHVTISPFDDQEKQFPLTVVSDGEVLLDKWIAGNLEKVEGWLRTYGGIRFHGFSVADAEELEKVSFALGKPVMNYLERTSPRTKVHNKVYTSTEYSRFEEILPHNELSYAFNWPMKIIFFCLLPAKKGGETPLTDVRMVLRNISEKTKQSFVNRKIQYIRNIDSEIGLSWREVYQVDTKEQVEEFLTRNGCSFKWLSDERLRVTWIKPALIQHPFTHQWIWFNHGLFYHKSLLPVGAKDAFSEEDLPFSTRYGDGGAIEPVVIEELKHAFEVSSNSFALEKGDVLLLDNMLIAHGRKPFEGDRKVLVTMLQPFDKTGL